MAECPECKTEIGRAAYCGCGWKRHAKAKAPIQGPRADCGYEGCGREAMCKIHTKTGWLNVCEDHYRIYHHAKAEEYCKNLGLDTIAKKRAHFREQIKQLTSRIRPQYMREPGQDDEEVHA